MPNVIKNQRNFLWTYERTVREWLCTRQFVHNCVYKTASLGLELGLGLVLGLGAENTQ